MENFADARRKKVDAHFPYAVGEAHGPIIPTTGILSAAMQRETQVHEPPSRVQKGRQGMMEGNPKTAAYSAGSTSHHRGPCLSDPDKIDWAN
jgi:hypothetical protein